MQVSLFRIFLVSKDIPDRVRNLQIRCVFPSVVFLGPWLGWSKDVIEDFSLLGDDAALEVLRFILVSDDLSNLFRIDHVDHPLLLDDVVLTQDVAVSHIASVLYQHKRRKHVHEALHVVEGCHI